MQRLILILTLIVLLGTAANAAPEIPIEKAIKIANGWLKDAGKSGDTFIAGASLDPTSVGQGQFVWAIRWNAPIALDERRRETGIEIAMDGTVARYVDKVVSGSASTPGAVGVPESRAELLNHRTRTTRPSILDLKH